jgi:hypothetical protein
VCDGEAGDKRQGGKRRTNFKHVVLSDLVLRDGLVRKGGAFAVERVSDDRARRRQCRPHTKFIPPCRRRARINREVRERRQQQGPGRQSEGGKCKTAAHATEGAVHAVLAIARRLRRPRSRGECQRHLIHMHTRYAAGGAENSVRPARGDRQHDEGEDQKARQRRPPPLSTPGQHDYSFSTPRSVP